MGKILLASSSIYRKEQLQKLNIDFSTQAPDVDEDSVKHSCADHLQLSRELAHLKAQAVASTNPSAIVIGGDQVASFNNTILSKPKTKNKAFEQLTLLSGSEHQLITSLAITFNGEELLHTCTAKMKMRPLSDEQIRRYIDIDEPLQSCGSYRIEALGISLFESIDCEDFTSIIGIPLMWTATTLSKLGVSIP
ncbi:Maf family protein [Teredinibacter turnerae]|uniref:Maf family protein n=1 Tax=Teredinibacter turnerae TaxID=2426 RepID=UPI000376DD3B|nr:Maf family protein [Teredinibacter turnerae]